MNHTDRQLGLPGRGLRYLQKNKRQTVAFMVCLGVSTLLWIMIKLNKHYNHELMVPVIVVPESASHSIKPLQNDTIRLEVSALGYQLFFNNMRKPGNLPLKIKPHQLRTGTSPNTGFITAQNLSAHLLTQLHPSTQILAVHPDTLFFNIDKVVSRTLPVVPNLTLDFAPNFHLYDTLRIIPDSVTLKGDKTVISAIQAINAKPIHVKNVDKSFSYRLNLINPAPETMELKTSQVTVSGEVTMFTDQLFTIPVTLPDSLKASFNAPTVVEVRCRIPEAKQYNFDPKIITATIGQIQTNQSHTHLQIVVNAPPFVKQITLSPTHFTIKTTSE